MNEGPVTAEQVVNTFIDDKLMLHREVRDLKATIEHQGRLFSIVSAVLDGEEPPAFGETHAVVARIYRLVDAYDTLMDDMRKLEDMAHTDNNIKIRDTIRNIIAREESR
jgi:hypothetical protein